MRIGELFAGWLLVQREAKLYRRFKKEPQFTQLSSLLAFVAQHERAFSIEQGDVRKALYGLDWDRGWKDLDAHSRESVLRAADEYTLARPEEVPAADWRSWLQLSQVAGRTLNVTEPRIAKGLLSAKRLGKLDDLPKTESDYLLSCYLKAYGDILTNSEVDDREFVLPILLEFAAVTQVLGPSEYSSTILQRWMRQGRRRPRALDGLLKDRAFFDASIRASALPTAQA